MDSLRYRFLLLCSVGLLAGSVRAATLEVGPVPNQPNTNASVRVDLAGAGLASGVQFDLLHVSTHMEPSVPILGSSATNHLLRTRPLAAPGQRRVIIFAPQGEPLPEAMLIDIPVALKSPLPSGGPSLAIRNVIFTDALGAPLTAAVAYPNDVENWRMSTFQPATEAELAAAADDADWSGSGLPNLFAFAFGANPLAPDPQAHPRASLVPAAGGEESFLSILFRLRKDRLALVEVDSEQATDLILQDWQDTPEPPQPTGVEDAQTVEMRARLTLEEDDGIGFLRLIIRRMD